MVGLRRIAGPLAALVAAAALPVVVAVPAAPMTLLSENFDDGVADGWSKWRQLGGGHRRLARLPPVRHERGRQGAGRLHDLDRLRGAGAGEADRLQRLGPARRGGGPRAEHDQLLRVGPHQHRPAGDHQTGQRITGHARRRRRLGGHRHLVHAAARSVGQHADRLPRRHTGRVGHGQLVRRRPGRAGHLLRRVVRRRPRRDRRRRTTADLVDQPAPDHPAAARHLPGRGPARRLRRGERVGPERHQRRRRRADGRGGHSLRAHRGGRSVRSPCAYAG